MPPQRRSGMARTKQRRTYLPYTFPTFKISMSECVRYPPKCAFSRVSNEQFSGGGAQPPPRPLPLQGGGNPLPHLPHPTPSALDPKLQNETKIGTLTFWNKVTPLAILLLALYIPNVGKRSMTSV